MERNGFNMTFWDELYFEITLHGTKAELRKFANFLKSGDLDEFFEIDPDYIIYDDRFAEIEDGEESEIIFTNDDYGIEIEEFDTSEFLEVFCSAARSLDLYGFFTDGGSDEYRFTSAKGDSYFLNARDSLRFNDELDEVALDEEKAAGEDE